MTLKPRDPKVTSSPARSAIASHGPGFVAAGLIALGVDAAVLTSLTALGAGPFAARVISILTAMIAAFFAHRRLTFAVTTPPTWTEFARFLAVAWTASAVNYAIYALVLIAWPAMPPVAALIAATGMSMGVSYVGMRLGVFRNTRD